MREPSECLVDFIIRLQVPHNAITVPWPQLHQRHTPGFFFCGSFVYLSLYVCMCACVGRAVEAQLSPSNPSVAERWHSRLKFESSSLPEACWSLIPVWWLARWGGGAGWERPSLEVPSRIFPATLGKEPALRQVKRSQLSDACKEVLDQRKCKHLLWQPDEKAEFPCNNCN